MTHDNGYSFESAGDGRDGSGKRFFVDLAANNPLFISNSFLLKKNGWDGLCIEPNACGTC